MSEQSHTFTKQTIEHLPLIKKIADTYSVSIRDLLGKAHSLELSSARVALAHALRRKDMSYRAIGLVMGRDHSSVRGLLDRAESAPRKERKERENVAARSEVERQSKSMYRSGSAALLMAIFATGKAYRPLGLDEQLAATEWAKKYLPLKPVGWME